MNRITDNSSDKSAPMAADKIVDALVDIRDELAGNVLPIFVIPKIWALIGRIERDADALAAASMDALRDSLAAILPPVSGGAPIGDHEDCQPWDEDWDWDSPDVADAYPAGYDVELDGYVYETGPTPIDVLGLDAAAADRYQPTAQDWADYHALRLQPGALTEADHVAIHGCC